MLRQTPETQMNGIQELRPCSNVETRQAMWVTVKNGEELGIFNAVEIAASFRERYASDYKPVVFED